MSTTTAPGRRAGPRLRRRARRLRRPSPRAIVIVGLVLAVLVGVWFWLRDSSLVAVRRVSVVGVSGADARAIRARLRETGMTMTTLDVSTSRLRQAVARYPAVRGITVATEFPHGLRIHVIEENPLAMLVVGGVTRAVAASGLVLAPPSHGTLPSIPASLPAGTTRVAGPRIRGELAVLAAAPYPLLARIGEAEVERGRGLVATLRRGPTIIFGDASQLAAKWRAAVAVLADSGSAGASYVDVTFPRRPVAGGGRAAAALVVTTPSAATTPSGTGAPTTTAPSGTATAPTTLTSTSGGATTPPVAPTTGTTPGTTGTVPSP